MTGTPIHPDSSMTHQIRGLERQEMINELVHQRPMQLINKLVSKSSQLDNTEMRKIPSIAIAKKMRGEALALQDRDKNMMEDLLKRKNEYSYINEIAVDPFKVYILQHDIIQKLKKSTNITAYFDATGNVAKVSEVNDGKILYYAMVVSLQETTFELAGMITMAHDQIQIANFFSNFKTTIITSNLNWPLFKDIVSDFSWANLNGMSLGLNGISMLQYVNFMHQVYTGSKDFDENLVKIHLCIGHIQKNLTRDVKNLGIKQKWDAKTTSDVKKMFSCIFLIKNYENFKKYFEYLSVVFFSVNEDQTFFDAYSHITDTTVSFDIDCLLNNCSMLCETNSIYQEESDSEDSDSESESVTSDSDDELMEKTQNEESLKNLQIFEWDTSKNLKNSFFAKSEFYKDAVKIYELIRKKQNAKFENLTEKEKCDLQKNNLMCGDFFVKFIKKIISLLPLILNVNHDNVPNNTVFTTNVVENYFQKIKGELEDQSIKLGPIPVPLGRLLEMLYIYNCQLYARLEIGYNKKATKVIMPSKSKTYKLNEQESQKEEWEKKMKKRPKSSQGTHLKPRAISSRKFPNSGTKFTIETYHDSLVN